MGKKKENGQKKNLYQRTGIGVLKLCSPAIFAPTAAPVAQDDRPAFPSCA
jgi:hypothetical protein